MLFRKDQNRTCASSGARATGVASGRHWGRALACLAVTTALASAVGPGQSGRPHSAVFPNHQANTLPDANQLMLMHQQQGNKQNIEAVNAERRKVIADESAMLLKLATDLKAEVDKSNKDTLSLTVIRRADMVEKLAHDMKEKMKLSIAAN